MGKIKKLPRGFWDSPEGRKALDKLRSRKVTASDLARELGTTEAAVYNASSKHTRVIASSPMLVDQAFMDRIIRFAEDILGEAVTQRLQHQESRIATLEGEKQRLETELDSTRRQAQESGAAAAEFQRRLTERTLKAAGSASSD